MGDHNSVRDLLGPYVMGALDPREVREVEEHLRACAGCEEEARELRAAHEALASFAAASEAPPQELKGRAVPWTEPSGGTQARGTGRGLPVWVTAAAAALLVLAMLGAVFASGLVVGGTETASATLQPTREAPEAGGEVSVQDTGENVEVSLEAWGLPPCEGREYYELWLAKGGERVSAGTFSVGESGRVNVELTAPGFAGSFPKVGVTGEVEESEDYFHEYKMLGGELSGA